MILIILKKTNKINENKNDKFEVFIYIPMLYECSEKLKKLFDYLKEIKEIRLINIYKKKFMKNAKKKIKLYLNQFILEKQLKIIKN